MEFGVGMSVKVCAHCRPEFKFRVSEDIFVFAHWVGDYYLVDVELVVDDHRCFCLSRLVWFFEHRH